MGLAEEGMKGAALMTVMIFFMFLPQWYFKWAVPKEMVRTQPQPSTLPTHSANARRVSAETTFGRATVVAADSMSLCRRRRYPPRWKPSSD